SAPFCMGRGGGMAGRLTGRYTCDAKQTLPTTNTRPPLPAPMSLPTHPRPWYARLPLQADAPAVTVVLVVAALGLVIVPLVRVLGDGGGAQQGLEPFLELVAVLLGLLVVAVSLHTLEASGQARANVL